MDEDVVHVYDGVLLSHFSPVCLSVTPWTVARHAPLSMEFSRQEYWSGLPYLPPGDLPKPGIEILRPVSPALQADSLPLGPPGKPHQGMGGLSSPICKTVIIITSTSLLQWGLKDVFSRYGVPYT